MSPCLKDYKPSSSQVVGIRFESISYDSQRETRKRVFLLFLSNVRLMTEHDHRGLNIATPLCDNGGSFC